MRSILRSLPLVLSSLAVARLAPPSIAQAPSNDECPGAIAISAPGWTSGLNNFNATPVTAAILSCVGGSPFGADVWYTFTVPSTGTYVVSTDMPTSLVTELAVYSNCGTALVGCAASGCGGEDKAKVKVLLLSGQPYFARVGTVGAQTGTFSLGVLAASTIPVNDECSSAIPLSGTGQFGPFSNVGATAGPTGQTAPMWSCGSCPSADVWFSWIAPSTGIATIDACNGTDQFFGAVIQIMPICPGAPTLACSDNDPCCGKPKAQLDVTQGTSYVIRVGGAGGDEGSFSLGISVGATVPPSNNECCGAGNLVLGANGAYSNVNAGTSMPWPCSSAGADVWFKHTATCTGALTIDTCAPETDFDTVIEAFNGTCGTLTSVACNDNSCGTGSRVTLPVVSGSAYYVRVGGVGGATGNFKLNLSCSIPNDECSGALPLHMGVNDNLSLVNATPSFFSGSSAGCAGGYTTTPDAWFTFTSPATGYISICSTLPFCFYDDCAGTGPALIGQQGDCLSMPSAPYSQGAIVTTGKTYYLRVAKLPFPTAPSVGRIDIFGFRSMSCINAGNGGFDLHPGLNLMSTTRGSINTGFSVLACPFTVSITREVYFRFVPPCTGTATISLCAPGSSTGAFGQLADPVLEITAVSCPPLAAGNCSDNQCGFNPSVTIPVDAGSPMIVRVGGNPILFNGEFDFQLYLSYTPGAGTISSVPTGCGGLTLEAYGVPTPGSPLAFKLAGVQGVGIVWLGLPMPSLPFCPPASCAQGASIISLFPTPSFSATIPCSPSVIGKTVALQGADVLSGGGCGLLPFGISFRTSDTRVVNIQ